MTMRLGISWTVQLGRLEWRRRQLWTDKQSQGRSEHNQWLRFCMSDHQVADDFDCNYCMSPAATEHFPLTPGRPLHRKAVLPTPVTGVFDIGTRAQVVPYSQS
jgi:hypothetical protein